MPQFNHGSVYNFVNDLRRRTKHMEDLAPGVPENVRKGLECSIRVFRDVIYELENSDIIGR